jgi:hypothetical protein
VAVFTTDGPQSWEMTRDAGQPDDNGNEKLSAAEAAVLTGQRRSAHALKLALLEMIADGALRLTVAERRGRLGRRHKVTLLVAEPGTNGRANPVLATLLRIVQETPGESQPDGTTGHPLVDVARRATAEWQHSGGFAKAVVAESLVRRGLLTHTRKRWLGLVPHSATIRTPNGQAIARRIEDELNQLMKLPQGVRDDPQTAVSYASALSPVTLLLGAAGPDRRQLDDAFRQVRETSGDGGGTVDWYWGLDTDGIRTFEEMSSTFDSLDAAGDSGSGDGDGDGGGDGGGGD